LRADTSSECEADGTASRADIYLRAAKRRRWRTRSLIDGSSMSAATLAILGVVGGLVVLRAGLGVLHWRHKAGKGGRGARRVCVETSPMPWQEAAPRRSSRRSTSGKVLFFSRDALAL
jgi:hypothetical protein